MLLQALSLVSGMLFLAGVILATNFTVAKNLANQKLSAALQLASSRAFNDAQTWARDSLALSDQENQPVILQKGAGSSQFGCVDTKCTWLFRDQWVVTGDTANVDRASLASTAYRLEPALAEGRLSMAVTTTLYKTLTMPLHALSSRSVSVTARYLNSPPYFVVTATNDVVANLSVENRGEGDTGGVAQKDNGVGDNALTPTAVVPSNYTDTTLVTQISCVNSVDAQSQNPFHDIPKRADMPQIPKHSYVPNDETMVWIYEAPCVAPSGTIVGLPKGTTSGSSGEYDHSGATSVDWEKGDFGSKSIAR